MKHLIQHIQRKLGVTKSEGIVVLLLLAGMVGGTIGRLVTPDTPTHQVVQVESIIKLLDSIAAIESASLANDPLLETESIQSEPYHHPTGQSVTTRHSATNNTLGSKGKILRININTASRGRLEQIPGIGPATAQKIVDMRRNRPFQKVDDLLDVKGIGPKKLEKMRPYVVAP